MLRQGVCAVSFLLVGCGGDNSSAASVRHLEKRNHPKNVRDPMIVLDGKTHVAASAPVVTPRRARSRPTG